MKNTPIIIDPEFGFRLDSGDAPEPPPITPFYAPVYVSFLSEADKPARSWIGRRIPGVQSVGFFGGSGNHFPAARDTDGDGHLVVALGRVIVGCIDPRVCPEGTNIIYYIQVERERW